MRRKMRQPELRNFSWGLESQSVLAVRRRGHAPARSSFAVGEWLQRVVNSDYRYQAVPGNIRWYADSRTVCACSGGKHYTAEASSAGMGQAPDALRTMDPSASHPA